MGWFDKQNEHKLNWVGAWVEKEDDDEVHLTTDRKEAIDPSSIPDYVFLTDRKGKPAMEVITDYGVFTENYAPDKTELVSRANRISSSKSFCKGIGVVAATGLRGNFHAVKMICLWTIVSWVVMWLAGATLLAASLGALFVGVTTTVLVAATISLNLLAAHMTDDELAAFFVRTIRAGDKVARS